MLMELPELPVAEKVDVTVVYVPAVNLTVLGAMMLNADTVFTPVKSTSPPPPLITNLEKVSLLAIVCVPVPLKLTVPELLVNVPVFLQLPATYKLAGALAVPVQTLKSPPTVVVPVRVSVPVPTFENPPAPTIGPAKLTA